MACETSTLKRIWKICLQVFEKVVAACINSPENDQYLDEVQPPLPQLVFTNEGCRLPNTACQLRLRQACGAARIDKPAQQTLVSISMNGPSQ